MVELVESKNKPLKLNDCQKGVCVPHTPQDSPAPLGSGRSSKGNGGVKMENKKRSYPEQKIHIQTVHYFKQLEALRKDFTFFHPYASGQCTPRESALRKALGLKAGVPDLFFLLNGGAPVMVELKADKGRLSEAQQEFHATAQRLGFQVYTVIAADAGQAIDRITEILQSHGWSKP